MPQGGERKLSGSKPATKKSCAHADEVARASRELRRPLLAPIAPTNPPRLMRYSATGSATGQDLAVWLCGCEMHKRCCSRNVGCDLSALPGPLPQRHARPSTTPLLFHGLQQELGLNKVGPRQAITSKACRSPVALVSNPPPDHPSGPRLQGPKSSAARSVVPLCRTL